MIKRSEVEVKKIHEYETMNESTWKNMRVSKNAKHEMKQIVFDKKTEI